MISKFISENLIGLILFVLRFGLTLTLFAFFTLAVKTIWQDLRAQTSSAAAKPIPPLVLQLFPSGENYSFNLNEISLGRDPGCDLHLTDESVSAIHARCYFRKNQWWFEDNGSSNGSSLNDTPVDTPTVLTSGDNLILGSVGLRIHFTL